MFGGRDGQPRILCQDRPLQLAQALTRLDPELLDERPPRLLVGLQGIGLPVGAVQREHQLRSRQFTVGML